MLAPQVKLRKQFEAQSTETSGSGGRAADRQSRACLSRRRVRAAALRVSTADGRPKGLRQLSIRRDVSSARAVIELGQRAKLGSEHDLPNLSLSRRVPVIAI